MNACNVIGNKANKDSIIVLYGSFNKSNSCLIENFGKAMVRFYSITDTCTIINSTQSNPSIINLNGLPYRYCLLSENESNSKCKSFIMINERCNLLRKRDNYILIM